MYLTGKKETVIRRLCDKLFAKRRHRESHKRVFRRLLLTDSLLLESFITHRYKIDKQKALPCRMHTQFHTWSVQCFKACRDKREKNYIKPSSHAYTKKKHIWERNEVIHSFIVSFILKRTENCHPSMVRQKRKSS